VTGNNLRTKRRGIPYPEQQMTPTGQQCALDTTEFHLPNHALLAVQTDTCFRQAQNNEIQMRAKTRSSRIVSDPLCSVFTQLQKIQNKNTQSPY